MKQFCEEVLKFLESEYGDAYKFEINHWISLPGWLVPGGKEKAELTIKMNPHYQLTIVNENMQYLFGRYRDGEFIEERNQYRWQMELVAMIDGG